MQALKSLNVLLRRNFSLSRIFYGSHYPTDLYEPDYLSCFEPDVPVYDSLNIQIKGYDYPLLESFQSHINKMANILDIEVEESWGLPLEKFQIQRFKPSSALVDTEYTLNIYERNVQVTEVPASVFPVFLRMLQESVPEGVSLRVHESLPEHEKIRYVPDNQLLSLKQQLDDLGGATTEKKKKR